MAGRAFSWHDDSKAPRVAVVNREFVRQVFGLSGASVASALGRHYKTADGTRTQVVGLVENGKYRTLTEDVQPAVFVPILQLPSSSTWVLLRTERDPQTITASIESSLHKLDPGLPFTIKPWTIELDSALFASRVATVALGVLGGLAALLAVTGIFGMAAYSVSKRMRELGLRMALGARKRDVLRSALGRAFRLLAIGSALGLISGIAAARLLASIVYQAAPEDPLVLCGVVSAMLLIGLLATWIPARVALGADPLTLLREQ